MHFGMSGFSSNSLIALRMIERMLLMARRLCVHHAVSSASGSVGTVGSSARTGSTPCTRSASRSSAVLLPNRRKSVTSLTSASCAMRRVVVPRKPCSPYSRAAASRIWSRVGAVMGRWVISVRPWAADASGHLHTKQAGTCTERNGGAAGVSIAGFERRQSACNPRTRGEPSALTRAEIPHGPGQLPRPGAPYDHPTPVVAAISHHRLRAHGVDGLRRPPIRLRHIQLVVVAGHDPADAPE